MYFYADSSNFECTLYVCMHSDSSAAASDSETITLNTGALQTFEILPVRTTQYRVTTKTDSDNKDDNSNRIFKYTTATTTATSQQIEAGERDSDHPNSKISHNNSSRNYSTSS